MNAVLKKLRFKGQAPVLLLGAPKEFEATAAEFGVQVDRAAKGTYAFTLAFVKSLAEARAAGKAMARALAEDGLFWLAYPKGTSRRYKGVDVNRDTAHAALHEGGFDGVSLVAIDEDWSAMRFKRTA